MRKNYNSKYKAKAVLEVLREAETLNEIASRLEVHPSMLGRWKNQAERELHLIFEDRKGVEKRAYEAQIQELYAQIGEVTAQLNWLKKKSGIDV